MKLVVFADIAALQEYSKTINSATTINMVVPHTIQGWPRVAIEDKSIKKVDDLRHLNVIVLTFIEKQNVIEAAELLAPMSKWTVFWRNGERDVYEGDDIQDAFRRAGVGAGALSAVDFYTKGNNNEYEWDSEKRNWDRIV